MGFMSGFHWDLELSVTHGSRGYPKLPRVQPCWHFVSKPKTLKLIVRTKITTDYCEVHTKKTKKRLLYSRVILKFPESAARSGDFSFGLN